VLRVVAEVGNEYNAEAQVLFTDQHEPVGYLPDWLAKLTAPCLTNGSTLHAVIDRVNDTSAGWHLRVLVTLHADEPFHQLRDRINSTTRSA
jgi:hypothetical protein